MAGLKHDLNHRIHLKLVKKHSHLLKPGLVGAHYGTGDVEVLFRESCVNICILSDLVKLCPYAVAGIYNHAVRPQFLKILYYLVPYAHVGTACDHYSGAL